MPGKKPPSFDPRRSSQTSALARGLCNIQRKALFSLKGNRRMLCTTSRKDGTQMLSAVLLVVPRG